MKVELFFADMLQTTSLSAMTVLSKHLRILVTLAKMRIDETGKISYIKKTMRAPLASMNGRNNLVHVHDRLVEEKLLFYAHWARLLVSAG